MAWTLADTAGTLLDVKEVRGKQHNPLVVGMLQMFATWIKDDETAWCGAFAGFVCKVSGYPTPPKWNTLRARMWLTMGKEVELDRADGNSVVVFKRGRGVQPGADVLNAPGHVGFYLEQDEKRVRIRGGNQGNRVSDKWFPKSQILGIRKLRR